MMQENKTIVPYSGEVPETGFSVSSWKDSYCNNEIDPKTNKPYGYRIKTDDGSVFGSKINDARIKNGLKPI